MLGDFSGSQETPNKIQFLISRRPRIGFWP